MFKSAKLKHILKVTATVVVLGVTIGFTTSKRDSNLCQKIIVSINNQYDNYYIDENAILNLMSNGGEEIILGQPFEELNIKDIEERVKAEPFIKQAEIYRDLKGNLLANARLRRPFARIINSGGGAYIAEDGTLLPLSDAYTSRTIVLTGNYFKNIKSASLRDSDEGEAIYELLNFIYENKFWRAQIAQIDIDSDLDVVMYPQVTKQYIEFGKPGQLEEKFKKLEVFYKKILPRKGWNTYERVNLEYKNQIIAE